MNRIKAWFSRRGSTSDLHKERRSSELGILKKKPKSPNMATLHQRLKSYEGRRKSFVNSEELAKCGMYYKGFKDHVHCFFCEKVIRGSRSEPWVEHARISPNCEYLILSKGKMFVNIVLRRDAAKEKNLLKDIENEMQQMDLQKTYTDPLENITTQTSVSENKFQAGNLAALETEHEELTNNIMCKVCMEEQFSVVFMPCNHMVTCTYCAVVLKTCPVCRAKITGLIKANM